MTTWFRPELDTLGPWEDWTLTPEELLTLQRAQSGAAASAIDQLRRLFGQTAAVFGAETLADRLGGQPIDETAIFSLAKAIAALDYFSARTSPPRPAAGGLTHPGNRRRWVRLRQHLLARARIALVEGGSGSILWHSILGRVPRNWIPVPILQKSLAAGLTQAGPYTAIDVNLHLAADRPGGLSWLAEQTGRTIAAVDAALKRGKPSLVELVRADEPAPSAVTVVLVYGMGKTSDGDHRLQVLHPETGRNARLLYRPSRAGAGRIAMVPDDQDRSTILALRHLPIEPARAPLFGPRRYLFWLLPWRMLWWIRRWTSLTFRPR